MSSHSAGASASPYVRYGIQDDAWIRFGPGTLDQRLEKNSILIGITADDQVLYGGKVVGISGVGARVRHLLNKEDLPVIIQADANSDHGVFSAVWSEVKNAGAKKISVSTRID